jgi:SAM-dependent methyltransferase
MEGCSIGALVLSIQGDDRAPDYHANPRRDITDLVPVTARRILDVGCGQGNCGRLLSQRGHRVAGIELVPEVARQASRSLDEVVCGDVETCRLPWPPASFDAILCADVLEHLLDPWRVLRRLSELLVPQGLLIASVPNIQNWRVIRGLLQGRWDYRARGILDRGHLRFFTRRTLTGLLEQAGLAIVDCRAVWNRTLLRRGLCALTLGWAEHFLARSYLIVGAKRLSHAPAG